MTTRSNKMKHDADDSENISNNTSHIKIVKCLPHLKKGHIIQTKTRLREKTSPELPSSQRVNSSHIMPNIDKFVSDTAHQLTYLWRILRS
jgi:hypothetical protein